MSGAVVGVTGATGHLGGLLLKGLLADAGVAEVRSVARRPLPAGVIAHPGGAPRLVHVCADVRAGEARRALEGCDLIYHLAAQVWRGRGPGGAEQMQAVNVEATRTLLRGAQAVVLASSAAVYGAWPDNPLPIEELHPARPNPECAYARHKLTAERICAEEAGSWVVARLSAVLGPHADARVARAVRAYRLAVPAVEGPVQALQWMDEDDAAQALLLAGRDLLAGGAVSGQVVNFGPIDWLSARELADLAGSRVVTLPRRVVIALAELGRRLALSPFGADRAVLIGGPLAMSVKKAEQLLGWRAAKSSREVMTAALERDWHGSPRNRQS